MFTDPKCTIHFYRPHRLQTRYEDTLLASGAKFVLVKLLAYRDHLKDATGRKIRTFQGNCRGNVFLGVAILLPPPDDVPPEGNCFSNLCRQQLSIIR